MSGLGHINRCLGFAEAIEECGGNCGFVGHFSPAAVKMVEWAGFPVFSADQIGDLNSLKRTAHLVREQAATCLVLDSYCIDAELVSKLRRSLKPTRLFLIDDTAALDFYDCDALVNFTLSGPDRVYGETSAEKHLGPEFFPARRWLRQVRKRRMNRAHAVATRVLIFGGGNDSQHATLMLTKAVAETHSDFQVCVILDETHPDAILVESTLLAFKNGATRINLQESLEESLLWADCCICGGGLTKYEAAFAGVPLATLALTPIQAADTALFAGRNAACKLGLAGETSLDQIMVHVNKFLGDSEFRDTIRKAAQQMIPFDSARNVALMMMEPRQND